MPLDALAVGNDAIAKVLDEIGDLIELKGENVFRAVTYRAAARSIRDLREPLSKLVEEKRLKEIPKVGPSVAEAIEQLVTTGRSKRHEELQAAVPPGLLTLLRVPGVGPATARTIYDHLKITSIDELEEAAKDHRLLQLPKIQAKTEENILKSIAALKQRTGRSLLHEARAAANEMVAYLRAATGAERISIAGSLRRYRETIGDVDIVVASESAAPIMEAFVRGPTVERILAQGETKSSVVVSRGLQIDLRVVPPVSYGAALLYFTGSKEHNVRLRGLALRRKLLLNEYGLYRVGAEARGQEIAAETEEDVYGALGLDWIPPELREDRGEIDAAAAHALPKLVGVEQVRGDLHTHTSWTDGRDPLADMARRAKAKGYAYLAVTDHSPGLGMTYGLSPERIQARLAEAAGLNAALETGTWIEVNGGPERLDLPDTWIRKAIERGATLVTNSDAHAIEELEWMDLAIGTARRGWATEGSIVNTRELAATMDARKKR